MPHGLILSSLAAAWMLSGCGHSMASKLTKPRYFSTLKSYKVKGRRYYPHEVEIGYTQRGVASWYGPNFDGKLTSGGEVYDMDEFTAAHKTWALDTIVRVTNLDNGKSTVVRISDRGPFVRGRIIDCSYAAGKELGLDKSGIANVEIEAIGLSKYATKGK